MLDNLNEKQKQAVVWNAGPLLVLAGAGTGKTRVLTTRIAYILNNNWARAWQILALTFTNKAANEMKRRVADLAVSGAGWNSGDLWCGTFHSICLRILRANAVRVGLRPDFLIYGEEEQKSVIKSLNFESSKTPSDFIEEFSRIKDRGLRALDCKDKHFLAYNAELMRLNAVDFGDIILKVLVLFKENEDVLSRYQKQFLHILVDEFQDINSSQMQFIKFIIPPADTAGRSLFCVGDEDQSIYSWRGAEIEHILDFEKNYSQSKIVIDSNYRSTGNILSAANSLIAHNTERIRQDKQLRPAPNVGAGEPVYVLTVPSDLDEVRLIADTIIQEKDIGLDKFTVLIRMGSLTRLFEEEFGKRAIPYKLIGATKFYDRAEIRDVISYLRLLVYPFDDIAFLRIIGKPSRKFGRVAIEKLRATGLDLMSALKTAVLTRAQSITAAAFLESFDFDWSQMTPSAAAQSLLQRSGYLNMWNESKDVDAPDRLSNIKELISNVISKYDTLADFLEHAALMTADDDNGIVSPDSNNMVRIMTIHAAKGLEFDTVFLPAWEEGIFPNDKAINEGALQEERRLAYVAITRARRRAIISNAMSRLTFGQRQYNSPSRFISEMDAQYLEFAGGASSYYSAYQPAHLHGAPAPEQPAAPKPQGVIKKSVIGKLVSHSDLGRGVVIEQDGDILTVAFSAKGIKKVAISFLKIIS